MNLDKREMISIIKRGRGEEIYNVHFNTIQVNNI